MTITSAGLTHVQYDDDKFTFTMAAQANPARLLARDATTPGELTLAGAESVIVGVSTKPADPDDDEFSDRTSVKFIDGGGLFEVKTAETTVAVGDYLWPAANGLVSKTPAGSYLFQAMSALTGTAGRLLVKRVPFAKATVHTLSAGEGTANAATIETGWARTVNILSVTVNGSPVSAGLTAADGSSDGEVDVAATSFTAGHVVCLITTPSASAPS